MKLIHLSDLHLGKRVNEYSMLEDQSFILRQILEIIDREAPDAVLIAGDIYDKTVPPAEAVSLCDDFLCKLSQRRLHVFVSSGNHDSAERLAFGNRLMDKSGIHISSVFHGSPRPVTLCDAYGEVDIYMLPFLKPAVVRRFYPEQEILSYTEAVRAAICGMERPAGRRCVLLAHQFVTGAERSESEELSVGGSENVDVGVFDGFSYVALGHIHGPQNVGSERIRYCGTPLKYSFSEAKQQKSVTVAELGADAALSIRTVALVPLHEMVELRGTYMELITRSFYENTTWQEDYTHITLTDEDDIPDAVGRLRTVYHNLMRLDYDNKRTRSNGDIIISETQKNRSPVELFADFYEMQNNQPLNEEQTRYMEALVSRIWGTAE